MVEEDRVVAIRFGHDYDPDCMAMDETLYAVSEKVQNFAVLYLGTSRLHQCLALRTNYYREEAASGLIDASRRVLSIAKQVTPMQFDLTCARENTTDLRSRHYTGARL
jgi:hypothetical protein